MQTLVYPVCTIYCVSTLQSRILEGLPSWDTVAATTVLLFLWVTAKQQDVQICQCQVGHQPVNKHSAKPNIAYCFQAFRVDILLSNCYSQQQAITKYCTAILYVLCFLTVNTDHFEKCKCTSLVFLKKKLNTYNSRLKRSVLLFSVNRLMFKKISQHKALSHLFDFCNSIPNIWKQCDFEVG